jgi:telomerase reverse transcriptase
MAGKRKRKRSGQGDGGDGKRQRVSGSFNGSGNDPVVKSALLAQYYPRVLSLREYLLSKLPATSKIRRKKILTVGRSLGTGLPERDQALAEALDKTLVGISRQSELSREERWQQWTSFSQKADTSASTLANISGVGLFSQSEVSICIVSLF